MSVFPPGFSWGTATAAHQVEGGNWNNDWWAWEHAAGSPCVEPSGDACDHYHRFAEDLALLADLGFDSYRFSLEWSRIEPEEGEWSAAALAHYRRMAETCREHGLDPVVTLHHFTTPRWVVASGGWAEPATADRFARFAEHAAGALGGVWSRVCTINEPNVVTRLGYGLGIFPPGEQDPARRAAADQVFVAAHHRTVEAVKAIDPAVPVGLTLAMSAYESVDGGDVAPWIEHGEGPYLDATDGDDFIGVQTYTRFRVGPRGPLGPPPDAELTQMGYEFYPEALEHTIRRAHARTGLPVLVTENGVATDDDERRIEFVRRALDGVLRCIDDDVPVEGYWYWSALDNFEWAFGYRPTFGLIAVDRTTQERTVKASARWLGSVANAGRLD